MVGFTLGSTATQCGVPLGFRSLDQSHHEGPTGRDTTAREGSTALNDNMLLHPFVMPHSYPPDACYCAKGERECVLCVGAQLNCAKRGNLCVLPRGLHERALR